MLHFIYFYAECNYAECRFAKCRGALSNMLTSVECLIVPHCQGRCLAFQSRKSKLHFDLSLLLADSQG
jgi:hypothetical protein